MSKIGVLLTGGTPACQETSQGRIPDNGKIFQDTLVKILDGKSGVDIFNVLDLDSSDFRGEQHEYLASEILRIITQNQDYIGFVVIHGTDTNAWTLASHSYMIKGLKPTVIHTGSIIPLSDGRSDFPSNFSGAIDGVFEDELRGTYHFFGDNLLPGTKTTKQYTEGYKPFVDPRSYMSFGVLDSQRRFNIDATFRERINEAHLNTATTLDIDTTLEKDIEQVVLHPFFDIRHFDQYREWGKKGIFIQGYGDANTPTSPDFQSAVKRCIDDGITVLLGSQCVFGERQARYQGGKGLIEMGAILMKQHTNEAALCKLAWALKKYKGTPDKIRAALEGDINGDLVLM